MVLGYLSSHRAGSFMKQWREIAQKLTLLTQLGLSFIMPMLVCVGICWFLCDRFSIGPWIYIIGFILGIGASFMTAYKFYLSVINRQKKEKKPKVSFNKH